MRVRRAALRENARCNACTRGHILAFTVIFYGLKDFCCKAVQLCATQRELAFLWPGSEKHAAQHPEKLRKKPSLNYKSAALSG
jgi:hypothetical protein